MTTFYKMARFKPYPHRRLHFISHWTRNISIHGTRRSCPPISSYVGPLTMFQKTRLRIFIVLSMAFSLLTSGCCILRWIGLVHFFF